MKKKDEVKKVEKLRSRRVERTKGRVGTKPQSQFGKRSMASRLFNFSTPRLEY